jgi:hypothetical protein
VRAPRRPSVVLAACQRRAGACRSGQPEPAVVPEPVAVPELAAAAERRCRGRRAGVGRGPERSWAPALDLPCRRRAAAERPASARRRAAGEQHGATPVVRLAAWPAVLCGAPSVAPAARAVAAEPRRAAARRAGLPGARRGARVGLRDVRAARLAVAAGVRAVRHAEPDVAARRVGRPAVRRGEQVQRPAAPGGAAVLPRVELRRGRRPEADPCVRREADPCAPHPSRARLAPSASAS